MVGHVPATVVPLERPEGVLFGAFHAGATAPDVTGFSQLSSKAPSTMLWYAGFTRSFEENPQPILDDLANHGVVLQLGWEPNGLTLLEILEGRQDAYLHAWMAAAREDGHPFLVRMLSEMNANWTDWGGPNNGGSPSGAERFRAAWRRIRNIAREERAQTPAPTLAAHPGSARCVRDLGRARRQTGAACAP